MIVKNKEKVFEKPQLTQIEDLTLKLAQANLALKHAEEERTQMLANISHDLRAPLTAIRSSIDYLMTFDDASGLSYEDLYSLIHLMNVRTATLEHLIQDLFYLTSLDNKSQAFHFETIDLIPVLEEYYFSSKEDSRYACRKLFLDIPEGLSALVSMDSHHMIRVMDNLFTNSLKYSEEGASITLHVRKEEDLVTVSVEDTGIGIPPESLDKVFNRSYTVSSSRTPNASSGSGLGLAIVQHIISSHKGTVCCESKQNKGSCFFFSLPCITNNNEGESR